MKVPKRISDLINQKQEYIESRSNGLNRIILRYQDKLLSEVLNKVIPELEVVNGIIVDNVRNMRILQTLDKVYRDFSNKNYGMIGDHVSRTTAGIGSLTKKYYSITLGEVPDYFTDAIKSTKELLNLRIGNDVSGGFMQKLIKNETLNNDIRERLSSAIVGRKPLKDLITELNETITGAGVKEGGLEYQVRRYAGDIYRQYDRAYNLVLARRLGLTYFIYQGGIIKDSRDFCVAHNNKVWTIEESKAWSAWTPAVSKKRGDFPAGYEIQQKNLNVTPGYMGYAGYNPLVDLGGYNCRHVLGYIRESLAIRMRPELKKE